MEPIPPQPGSSIDPRHAVGRTGTTRRARRELLRGNNLSLTDPRRMGKTVWMDVFCAAPGDGLLAVKVDYEGVQTAAEFLGRTLTKLRDYTSLPNRARTRLASIFDGWEIGAGPVSVKPNLSQRTPLELLGITIGELEGSLDDGVLFVVAMDEVPMAVQNITANEGPESAEQLLQALRNLRKESKSIRWILCGSIGFHHVLRRCGATEGVVNDLINLPLGPLAPEEAIELATRLLLGIDRSGDAEVLSEIVTVAGAIPFLIHAIAHRLEDMATGTISMNEVRQAFDDFVNDRDESRAVTHLLTRLGSQYGDTAEVAEAILDKVASEGELQACDIDDSDGLSDILNNLIDDHYLVDSHGSLAWRYPVLRDIWIVRRKL